MMGERENQTFIPEIYYTFGITNTILAIHGIVTNILSVGVLCKLIQCNRSPMFKLLLSLACSDLMMMLSLFFFSVCFFLADVPVNYSYIPRPRPPDLEQYGISYNMYVLSKVMLPILNLFVTISNWSIALISLWRLIGIALPLNAAINLTNRKAVILIILIYTIITALHVSLLVPIYSKDEHGAIHIDYDMPSAIIQNIIMDIIPLFLSLCLVIGLSICLSKAMKYDLPLVLRGRFERRKKERQHITLTLIIVNVIFVVLCMPSFIAAVLVDKVKIELTERNERILFSVTSTLSAFSYSIKFYGFMLSGETFRVAIPRLICRISTAVNQEPTTTVTITKSCV